MLSIHDKKEAHSQWGEPGLFETRDFYLACFLRCMGYELLALREGRRRVFIFKDKLRRHDDVLAYYNESSSVRPLAFAGAIKDMKSLLYNA